MTYVQTLLKWKLTQGSFFMVFHAAIILLKPFSCWCPLKGYTYLTPDTKELIKSFEWENDSTSIFSLIFLIWSHIPDYDYTSSDEFLGPCGTSVMEILWKWFTAVSRRLFSKKLLHRREVGSKYFSLTSVIAQETSFEPF